MNAHSAKAQSSRGSAPLFTPVDLFKCYNIFMLITSWRKSPTEDLYIRTSYEYSGPIIKMGGMRPGKAYPSSRRYSVIDATGTDIKLRIISSSYTTAFGVDDYAIHDKYNSGEIVVLMEKVFTGTLEDALKWPGVIQTMMEWV